MQQADTTALSDVMRTLMRRLCCNRSLGPLSTQAVKERINCSGRVEDQRLLPRSQAREACQHVWPPLLRIRPDPGQECCCELLCFCQSKSGVVYLFRVDEPY